MGLLGTTKRRKIKHLGELGLTDPLAVTPAAEPDVETRPDEDDLLHLRRSFAPKPGLYGWLSRVMRYRHEVRVDLDERGTMFWRLMDGRRNLDTIAAAMSKRCDLDRSKAREAVIVFVKMLMTRRLVYLKVPTSPKE